MELRELRAFVVVVEEGGLSAAARRLHISQPALSQTIGGLERRIGVKLLVRGSMGVRTTDAGATLLREARAVLARHDQAVRAMAAYTGDGGGVLRIGIPLELPPGLLDSALAELAGSRPGTKVQARHLSTAEQLAALQADEIDVGLLRERPPGEGLDATLVVRENLGVLLAAEQAAELAGPSGSIALDALAGLEWVGFPRSGSPAWYDELTAILRSHGLDLGPAAPEGQILIPDVKLAAVGAGRAFALAPPDWQSLPDHVTWSPLAGHPLVRRTWAVWPAASRRRDLGRFVAALDRTATG
ncbi:LysR family transcriptional regulator [Streptomyces cocklensis]|uniref:DNA-binding transcriptional regulator, LysR family n=1 Tax=Actinacidiphila cocklensis TaxID=887465 RepID=A0A9W4GPI8_9ACTN|nr:LysR family transcriptional regulator [Actinacidiphila cocklensis]MDD1058430.1 LysR family transcriptional regulator [Actinacidiphila cocklensis]CAG6390579.1 DNA-binding transcriptional regulator, LysR family [Actinacidiphila cocklensis]